jgi:hypothetical protein
MTCLLREAVDIHKYSTVEVDVDVDTDTDTDTDQTRPDQTRPDQTRIGDSSPSVSFPIRPGYSPLAIACAGLRAYYGCGR